jgi:hypothetical protein
MDQPIECADFGAFGERPGHQLVIIRGQPLGRRPFQEQSEVPPRPFRDRPEIAVLDIESADQHRPAVCQRHLLVIADEVAPAERRMEFTEHQPLGDERREIILGCLQPEPIDQQRYLRAAVKRPADRLIDQRPRLVLGVDIIEQAEGFPGAVDQPEQGRQPAWPVGKQRQPIAVDLKALLGRWRVGGHCPASGGRTDSLQAGHILDFIDS